MPHLIWRNLLFAPPALWGRSIVISHFTSNIRRIHDRLEATRPLLRSSEEHCWSLPLPFTSWSPALLFTTAVRRRDFSFRRVHVTLLHEVWCYYCAVYCVWSTIEKITVRFAEDAVENEKMEERLTMWQYLRIPSACLTMAAIYASSTSLSVNTPTLALHVQEVSVTKKNTTLCVE
jgi:hypothetical protein